MEALKITAKEATYCPNCRKPIGAGEVYRGGFEADSHRTIPMTFGRGEYCDHFRVPTGYTDIPERMVF